MDYLPIQASSVPCEHIFLSSAETDTKKRNRISPILMEALQMLKYSFKKNRLNFTAGMKLDQHKLLDDKPDEPSDSVDQVLPQDETVDSFIGRASLKEGDKIGDEIFLTDF
jgi:hypothetical protein